MKISIILMVILFGFGDLFSQSLNGRVETKNFESVSFLEVDLSVDVSNTPDLLPRAIVSFYEADWEKSQELFRRLKKQNQQDPLPYFFEAMIPFWDYFFGGSNSEKAVEFLELAEIAINIGEQKLKESPNDTSAILLLSGLHGYRSLVAAQEKKYRTAMSSGVTGYSYTKVLMKLDNEDPNTLMGQGVFHYMMGSIPAEVRWMARLAGLSGDKQQGLMLLEKAAMSDSYVSNDARMFLAYLYERDNELVKAISHLQHLSEKYPYNPIFKYNIARLHEQMGNFKLANEFYTKVITLNSSSISDLRKLSEQRISLINNHHLQ